ncbi:hypothetical protein [Flammeovirga agarivorans]|uniref:Uncharacterized protein n=1 Tax=Flammeovirga agarivorans TaxID=2726742 RepID=A0A7X8SIJ1_9BACT|nr:hypothetical protein [Flammeovirga agarivorans]NLR90881.1 hypothetical protein [Flammeovirga agarivorans]
MPITLLFTVLLFSSFSTPTYNSDDPYTHLQSFIKNGGVFEDNIHVFIVEFRRSHYVNAHIEYDKAANKITLKFKDTDGSMHHEVIQSVSPHKETDTPSVITFDDSHQDDNVYVSVSEYSGKLSVIWNGENYQMIK